MGGNAFIRTIKILVIEDNPADTNLLKELLKENDIFNFKLYSADTLKRGIDFLGNNNIDIVILDLSLPDSSGIDTFRKLYKKFSSLPMVIFSGLVDEEKAISAVREGAEDYLLKGEISPYVLSRAITYAIERKKYKEELKEYRLHLEKLVEERTKQLRQANENLKKEIEERKAIQAELLATNYFNKTLLEAIPFGMDIVDSNCRILYCNKKLQEKIGKDVIGKRCYMIYKDDKEQCLECPVREGIEIGETKKSEVQAVLGGRDYIITHTGMLYKGKKAILEIFEDITDYKNTLKKLEEAERFASLGRMSAVFAHEFRNQLAVIRNISYFLQKKIGDVGPSVNKHFSILNKTLNETERIINNILTFSHAKEVSFKRTDVQEILKECRQKISPQRITIKTSSSKLPFSYLDPAQIERAFINIILNGLQAMKDEDKKLTISVEVEGDYLKIVFQDSGCGIKEEDKSKIFQPFFTTKARGVGLGLSIVKTIIEQHKGTIELESIYGKGTSVIVRLPLL